jgi:outer membrane biosynthesis protein TonB
MKPLRQNAAILLLCSALGIFAGCEHKKPVLIVPKQPPPAAEASPSPTPTPATAQTEQQPQEPAAQPQATPSEQPKSETEQQEKTRHAKKSSRHKPAGDKSTSEVARNTNKKVIPAEKAEPTPSPGPISAAPTAGQDQASIEQLLQAAEANLNSIKRQLTKAEEINRAQVKEFITQSRNAITENDLARAHTWAVKAQLLSNELVKPR